MLKSLIQNVLKNTLFLFFLRHLNHARNLMQKLDWRTKIHFWLETSEKSPISMPMQGRERGFTTCKILKGEHGGCPHGADGVKLTSNFEFAIYPPQRLNSRPTKRIRTCTGKDLPSKQNYQLCIYLRTYGEVSLIARIPKSSFSLIFLPIFQIVSRSYEFFDFHSLNQDSLLWWFFRI